MSRATKRKHVIREVLVEEIRPPTEEQMIVQVLAGRGNNLHLVTPSSGEPFLASMPTKFRRNVWIKRGDYLLVEPIPEGDKVKAEIVAIVTQDHKKYYRELGIWPSEFDSSSSEPEAQRSENQAGDKSEESEEEDLFVNKNRQMAEISESDETDEDESENEADDRTEDSTSGECVSDDAASDAEDRTGDSVTDGQENGCAASKRSTSKTQINVSDVPDTLNSCQGEVKQSDVVVTGGVC